MTEDQFRKCFDTQFQGLYLYAYTLTRNNAEAKDVVQTAFIKMWSRLKQMENDVNAKSYLYKAVYRLSLNVIRNNKIRGRHLENMPNSIAEVSHHSIEAKELHEKIRGFINDLPKSCREIFLKVRTEGKKYREVAQELQISEKTVETQMSRAMKQLRDRLNEKNIGYIIIMNEFINLILK